MKNQSEFWKTTLGGIARKDRHGLVDGPFGSNLPASEYTSSGIPVIRGSNLSLGQERFRVKDYVFVSEQTANRLSRSLCHPDDIIFTKKGTLGQTGIVPRTEIYKTFLLSSNQMKLSVDTEIADPLFVYYYVSSPISRERILREAMTTGVPKINLEYLRKFSISLPPLPTQRKIAAILSAYDDLIENNTRRIEILEEMARSLHREWFVNFRFPGHEQVKMVDSELGLIPEDWKVVTLQDITSYINRGISPKYDDSSVSIVINQKCIRNGRLNLELVRKHSKQVPSDKLVHFGDVLVNSTGIGTLGRVTQVYQNIQNCSIDSHVSIVRPNKTVNIDYFGFTLLNLEPYFSDLGVGATGQTELRRQSLYETIVLIPPEHFQGKFSEIVAPMRQLCLKLSTKNGFLRQTRDLLLPKLISGELDVEKLDINTGEIAA